MSGVSASIKPEIDFYMRREREERLAAAAATERCARQAHLTLAEHYAERVKRLSEKSTLSDIANGLWRDPALPAGGSIAT